MKKIAKKVLAFVFVLLLVVTTVTPAFADGTYHAITGTTTVYRTSTSNGYQYSYLILAYSEDSASQYMSLSNVSISNNTCGASLAALNWDATVNVDRYYWSDGSTDNDGYIFNAYYAVIRFQTSGSCTINYKVGSSSYTRTLRVLSYTNPIKSLTIKDIYGNKDLAPLTKTSAAASSTISVSKTVTNKPINATPVSGWKFSSIECRDLTTGMVQEQVGGENGFTAGYIKMPVIRNNRNYVLYVRLYNTSNGAAITLSYRLNGTDVNGRWFSGSVKTLAK